MVDANIRITGEARDRLAAVAASEGLSLRAYLVRLAESTPRPPMTPVSVRRRVAEVAQLAAREDYEAAHSLEHDLYLGVLQAIAGGSVNDPTGCAAEAVKAADLCPRWG